MKENYILITCELQLECALFTIWKCIISYLLYHLWKQKLLFKLHFFCGKICNLFETCVYSQPHFRIVHVYQNGIPFRIRAFVVVLKCGSALWCTVRRLLTYFCGCRVFFICYYHLLFHMHVCYTLLCRFNNRRNNAERISDV